jgi:hypothetical protein
MRRLPLADKLCRATSFAKLPGKAVPFPALFQKELFQKEPAMRQPTVLIGAFAILLFVGAGVVRAEEESVPQDKILKPVMDALLSKFPQAKIDKCTKAKEGDDVVYDIEFKQQERKCEADITDQGVYINYEKAIESKDLPKAVKDSIEKRYPKSSLQLIMEETEVKGKDEKLAA